MVLSQMVKHGVLSQTDFDRLKSRPIRLNFERQPEALGPAPHLAVQIRRWLIDWADRNNRDIYADGLIVHTTIDSRLQGLANQAVRRQMEALQAVADVEWGRSSDAIALAERECLHRMRRRVQPFAYFWKTKPGLDRQASSGNPPRIAARSMPAQRRQVAMAQLKDNKEFMDKLRAEKTRLQAGFVAIDPATGQVKRGSVAATSRPISSIMWRKPGGNRARRLKYSFTARRSSRACRRTNASPIAPWRFPCRTAPSGVRPINRSPPAGA